MIAIESLVSVRGIPKADFRARFHHQSSANETMNGLPGGISDGRDMVASATMADVPEACA